MRLNKYKSYRPVICESKSKSVKDFNCINLTFTLMSKVSRINYKLIHFSKPFSSILSFDDVTRTHLVNTLEKITSQERVSD